MDNLWFHDTIYLCYQVSRPVKYFPDACSSPPLPPSALLKPATETPVEEMEIRLVSCLECALIRGRRFGCITWVEEKEPAPSLIGVCRNDVGLDDPPLPHRLLVLEPLRNGGHASTSLSNSLISSMPSLSRACSRHAPPGQGRVRNARCECLSGVLHR